MQTTDKIHFRPDEPFIDITSEGKWDEPIIGTGDYFKGTKFEVKVTVDTSQVVEAINKLTESIERNRTILILLKIIMLWQRIKRYFKKYV